MKIFKGVKLNIGIFRIFGVARDSVKSLRIQEMEKRYIVNRSLRCTQKIMGVYDNPIDSRKFGKCECIGNVDYITE